MKAVRAVEVKVMLSCKRGCSTDSSRLSLLCWVNAGFVVAVVAYVVGSKRDQVVNLPSSKYMRRLQPAVGPGTGKPASGPTNLRRFESPRAVLSPRRALRA